jgi:hypothetical protein
MGGLGRPRARTNLTEALGTTPEHRKAEIGLTRYESPEEIERHALSTGQVVPIARECR